jgi:hypothetical protein
LRLTVDASVSLKDGFLLKITKVPSFEGTCSYRRVYGVCIRPRGPQLEATNLIQNVSYQCGFPQPPGMP